ncbi:MAG: permease, partial [Actinomycetota bacterium]|nr:permease [Actinomycetota bacterium]
MVVLEPLKIAFFMFWQVFWSLALGFVLSGVVQTVISKRAIASALGNDSPRSVALASGFGMASSSCSYAAVALARSLFRRGATLSNAIVFEFASTNLVIELGLILLVLL